MGLKMVRVVLAAGLVALCAAGLTGCHGGTNDELEVGPWSSAADDYQVFQDLMAQLPDNVTIDYFEEYTVDSEAGARTSEVAFTALVDSSGAEARTCFTYTDAGTEFTVHRVGDRIVEVYDDAVVEGSYAAGAWHGADAASVALDLDYFMRDFAVEDNLVAYDYSKSGNSSSFTFSSDFLPLLGATMLINVESAEVTYTFTDQELSRVEIEATGLAAEAGKEGTGTTTTQAEMTFSDWGTTVVPDAPEPDTTMQLGDLDAAKAAVQAAMDGLGDNFTSYTGVAITLGSGAAAQTTESVFGYLLDSGRVLLYFEMPDSPLDGVGLVIDGDKKMALKDGEEIDASSVTVPEDADGTKRARELLECATDVAVYTLEDGTTQYGFGIDVQKFSALADASGFAEVSSVRANYNLDTEGRLTGVLLEVVGTASDAPEATDVPLKVETNTWFEDWGTTEVPEL